MAQKSSGPVRNREIKPRKASKPVKPRSQRLKEAENYDEERLRLFAEHAPVALAMFDTEMRYLIASDRWLSDYHLSRETLRGRSHYEVFPDLPERWKEVHGRCLAGAVERANEDQFDRGDGTVQWVRWEVHPWHRAPGVIGGIVIFSEDITERVLAEAALKRSEAALKEAQQLAGVGSWDWDITSDQHTWSEQTYRIYGRDPALPAATYPDVQKYFTPESWKHLAAAVEKSLSQGNAYECDAELIRTDGTRGWITARGQAMRDAAGTIIRLHGTVQDITTRRHAEQELRKSAQELSDFFAESPLGVLWVDPHGRILRANRANLDLLGRKEGDVVGRAVADFHMEFQVVNEILAHLRGREVVQNQAARIRHRGGTIKQVRIDAYGLWDGDNLLYSRWFVRDVTWQAELEREILVISEREQRRLGHDLHDDLCQQLAGIEFLCECLARDLETRSAAEVAQARAIAQGVQQAIVQTRDLARGLSPVGLEAGGLLDGLRQLAERTRKVFRRCCDVHADDGVRTADHAVAIHLYRIAQEAVSNAVKHGRAKQIDISLSVLGNDLQLRVRDNGSGMGASTAKSTGMGLKIMRYRAGVIGGALFVQPNPDGGTDVVCTVANGRTIPAKGVRVPSPASERP